MAQNPEVIDDREMLYKPRNSILTNGDFVRARINHQVVNLDVQSTDVAKTLSEVRKILECLGTEGEELSVFDLRNSLSLEFQNNASAMEEIQRLLGLEQRFRVVKEAIPAIAELDLLHGRKSIRIEHAAIHRAIASLMEEIEPSETKHALVHVKGMTGENDRLMILDHIHERVPDASVRAYSTQQDLDGKVVVEAVFFGDYEE